MSLFRTSAAVVRTTGSRFTSYLGSRPKASTPIVRSFKSPALPSNVCSTVYVSNTGYRLLFVNRGCATRRLSCSRTSTALGRDSAKIVSLSDCGDIPILHSSAGKNEPARTAQELHSVFAIHSCESTAAVHGVRDDFAPGRLAGIPHYSMCWVVIVYHTSLLRADPFRLTC